MIQNMVCFRASDELRRKLNMLTAAQNTSIQQVMLSLAERWVEKAERDMERKEARRREPMPVIRW